MKTRQLIRKLEEINPGLEVGNGTSHYKIFLNGKLIQIIPHKLAKEGLALNTKAKLRREGVRIPS